jgi:predicted nucleic acid-binding protein
MELVVFADSNIFLDAFLDRKPTDIDCIEILDLARNKKIGAHTSSSCLLTVMYFLKKDGMSRKDVAAIMLQLLVFVSLVSPEEQAFKNGLLTDFNDLEDAVQYYTALQIKGIDYFITSNIKDFKKATPKLPVLTPTQFLKEYRNIKPK